MGPYDPAEPLAWIIEQLEKGREFARAGGQTISSAMMMVSKLIIMTKICRPQDVGKFWIVFPPSASRAENISNNRRKGGVHRNSAKYMHCTTALSRIVPLVDQRHTKNCAGNVNTRLQAGRIGTSQCSPYQLELRGNVTVGTDDCDHELYAGATKNTRLITNQPSDEKKKVLLLELQEQFHSQDQNLLSKESETSRGSKF